MYTLLLVDIQILSFQSKRLFIVLLEWKFSRSVVSDSLPPHGLQPTRLLRPRDFPGGSTGVGCHFLLQRIFPTQRLNPGLSQCRPTLYHLSHQESSLTHVLLHILKKKDSHCIIAKIRIRLRCQSMYSTTNYFPVNQRRYTLNHLQPNFKMTTNSYWEHYKY